MFKSTFALVAFLLLAGAPPLMGHPPPVKTYDSIMGSHPMMSHNPMMSHDSMMGSSHMKSHDSMIDRHPMKSHDSMKGRHPMMSHDSMKGRHPMKCHDSMMDLSHMMSHIFNYIRNHPMMSHISNYISNHKMRLNDIVHGPVHQPIPTHEPGHGSGYQNPDPTDIVHGPVHQPIPTQEPGHGGGHLNPDHTDIVHGPVHQTLPIQGPGHGGGHHNLYPTGNCNSEEGFFMVPNSNNQCFKHFNETLPWDATKTLCNEHGLRLAEPRDPEGLRKYTQKKFGNYNIWLGARGNNSAVRWISDGRVIANDSNLWHDNGVGHTGTSYCLELLSTSWNMQEPSRGPYRMTSCVTGSTLIALCELVTPEPPTTTTTTPGNCNSEEGFFMVPNSNNQCFKHFNVKPSWYDTKALCIDQGLRLAEPRDPEGLRTYTQKKFGNYNIWLGARGDNSSVRWLSDGTAIANDSDLWHDGGVGNTGSDYCLELLSTSWNMQEPHRGPYRMNTCITASTLIALCELVM